VNDSVALPHDAATGAPAPIVSPRELLPWAAFAGVLMMLLLYFVGAEQGVASMIGGDTVHELVHDGRHLLGFPCH
jgi:hypothetical protein